MSTATGWVSSLYQDATTIWHLIRPSKRGVTHAERLENFYGPQAGHYDSFRKRLLHGRELLFQNLTFPSGGTWVDLGAGTGENVERAGEAPRRLSQIHLVDLSRSLLNVAQQRVQHLGLADRVNIHEADATSVAIKPGSADVVTFSYSLTMIPNWFAAIDHALTLLKPGGELGVVDFFVSRKHTLEDEVQHGWVTRHFWPTWFASDDVFLDPNHLAMLRTRTRMTYLHQGRGKVPYLPFGRVPHYVYIGTKPSPPAMPGDSIV